MRRKGTDQTARLQRGGDLVSDNVWGWVDGTEFDYDDFGPNEPSGDGDCASCNYNSNGKFALWNDAGCGNNYQSFCRMDMCECTLTRTHTHTHT